MSRRRRYGKRKSRKRLAYGGWKFRYNSASIDLDIMRAMAVHEIGRGVRTILRYDEGGSLFIINQNHKIAVQQLLWNGDVAEARSARRR